MCKKQNLTKFFSKNKSVESTDYETGLPDAALRKVSFENTEESSKAESVNTKMSGSRSSYTIPVTLCIVIFAERQTQIFRLYSFKIYSFIYFMFLYLQVLINKKDKYKDK
jgi:hypothetical protein